MIIPKEFRLGGQEYKVIQRVCMRAFLRKGYFDGHSRRFELGLHSNFRKRGQPHGRAFSTEEVSQTFWHEVTHAILYDMNHPLWNDETFVDAFSQRLNEVVGSARL